MAVLAWLTVRNAPTQSYEMSLSNTLALLTMAVFFKKRGSIKEVQLACE